MVHHIVNIFAKEGWVFQAIGCDKGFFVVAVVFAFVVALQPSAHNHEHNDDAYHADGVGHGKTQCRHCRGLSQLFECLLCSTECRTVGGGSAKHSHKVSKGQPSHHCYGHSDDRANGHNTQREDVEPSASVAERGHKSWPHLQTEGVNKQDESETFGIGLHLRIKTQAHSSGQDAGEEDKSDAKTDAFDAKFGQRQSESTNSRENDHCLNGRGFSEKFYDPHKRATHHLLRRVQN